MTNDIINIFNFRKVGIINWLKSIRRILQIQSNFYQQINVLILIIIILIASMYDFTSFKNKLSITHLIYIIMKYKKNKKCRSQKQIIILVR